MKMNLVTAAAAVFIWSGIAVAETWTGTGTLYDGNRQLIGSYELELDITETTAGRSSKVLVKIPGGSVLEINCSSTGTGNSWSKTCDNGMSGGGYYFEKGLISEYVGNNQGLGQASTIVFDDDNSMRILRTELENDNVRRFYVESLTKTVK